MSQPNSSDRLTAARHREIFDTLVLKQSGMEKCTTQDAPKAILLAGQPGAGKGNLVQSTMKELLGDAIVIDPDKLRDYHPEIARFRSENPYTWSQRSMADAGRWATELRDAAVAARKNIIVDGTLSNAETAVKMIQQLQSQGYEVEVRAIATHRLESELGIDVRFASSFDLENFGRHVPIEFHDKSYSALASSLDLVNEKTTAPVRIYNREGIELYDNRVDPRPPSQALEAERNARLRFPHHTQALNEGYARQLQWHETLPERVAQQPGLPPETQRNLLAERQQLEILPRLQPRAAGVELLDELARPEAAPARVTPVELPLPGRNCMAGAGVLAGAGVAASAYDAHDTGHRIARLLQQENAVAARSEAMHFAGRGAGGWVGGSMAAGLFGTGSAGPIALAVADAYLLSKAGEKAVDLHDSHRIYTQTSASGETWRFNGRDWLRQGQADLTPDARDNPEKGQFRASPETARELYYLASREAVQQAMGKFSPEMPYSRPPDDNDAVHLYQRNWSHDPATQTWSRMVADEVDRNDMPVWTVEQANPAQNARLHQQAMQVIEANIAHGPAAMAVQFEREYKIEGWRDFGDVPAAVQQALNPDALLASDGKRYERNATAQWQHGSVVAQGNIALELDATRQLLQPAVAAHRDALAQMPERQPPTPQQRDQADLLDAYAGYGIRLHGDYLAAITLAANRTRQTHGIAPGTAGYALEADAHGRFDVTRPLLHTRDDANGVIRTVAVTSGEDIQRALLDVRAHRSEHPQPANKAPGHALPSTPAPHDARQQPDSHHHASKPPAQAAIFPPDHKDHALFDAIRQQLPKGTSDEKASDIMRCAKANGIESVNQLKTVVVDGDRAFVMGKTVGDMAVAQLSSPAPRIHETLQKTAIFDQQQQQQLDVFRQQQQHPGQTSMGPRS